MARSRKNCQSSCRREAQTGLIIMSLQKASRVSSKELSHGLCNAKNPPLQSRRIKWFFSSIIHLLRPGRRCWSFTHLKRIHYLSIAHSPRIDRASSANPPPIRRPSVLYLPRICLPSRAHLPPISRRSTTSPSPISPQLALHSLSISRVLKLLHLTPIRNIHCKAQATLLIHLRKLLLYP